MFLPIFDGKPKPRRNPLRRKKLVLLGSSKHLQLLGLLPNLGIKIKRKIENLWGEMTPKVGEKLMMIKTTRNIILKVPTAKASTEMPTGTSLSLDGIILDLLTLGELMTPIPLKKKRRQQ